MCIRDSAVSAPRTPPPQPRPIAQLSYSNTLFQRWPVSSTLNLKRPQSSPSVKTHVQATMRSPARSGCHPGWPRGFGTETRRQSQARPSDPSHSPVRDVSTGLGTPLASDRHQYGISHA
eukprot:769869-Rhodomonas_salina.1